MEVPNDFYVSRHQLSRFGNTDKHKTWLRIFNVMIVVYNYDISISQNNKYKW
jgi:hypothetical protein